MDEIQSGISNRQIEAEDYLKKHKINELFVNITSFLVFKKPGNINRALINNTIYNSLIDLNWFELTDNPKEAIIEFLERLKKSKQVSVLPPTLFEDQNLHSIFGMLDPVGKGHINFRQYVEGI